jgi:hypothetical protein
MTAFEEFSAPDTAWLAPRDGSFKACLLHWAATTHLLSDRDLNALFREEEFWICGVARKRELIAASGHAGHI